MRILSKLGYLPRHNQGFTLLEVLVAMVILAIGLLGVASLQLTSFQSSYKAHLRAVANYEAAAIIDIMRTNLDEVEKGTASKFHGPVTGTASCTGYSSVGCNSSDMAVYEINQWLTRLGNKLPSGRASIEISKLAETVAGENTWAFIANVTVYWDEDKTGATGLGCDPDNAADLSCLNVVARVFEEFN